MLKPFETWTDTHAFRTGCFFNHVMAAINCGKVVLTDIVNDPTFAYCLDAPDYLPSGSQTRSSVGQPEPRIHKR